MAEREGFEPSIRCNPYDDLANRCLQPLGHLSVATGYARGGGPLASGLASHRFVRSFVVSGGSRYDASRMDEDRRGVLGKLVWLGSALFGALASIPLLLRLQREFFSRSGRS